jgi:hypothetical protein
MGRGGESGFLPGASTSNVLPPIPSNEDSSLDPEVRTAGKIS